MHTAPVHCRNFYHEHPAVTARSQAEVDEYRRKREVHVVGTGVPRPVTNFEEASFPGEVRSESGSPGFSVGYLFHRCALAKVADIMLVARAGHVTPSADGGVRRNDMLLPMPSRQIHQC